jgi:hypothetical protein
MKLYLKKCMLALAFCAFYSTAIYADVNLQTVAIVVSHKKSGIPQKVALVCYGDSAQEIPYLITTGMVSNDGASTVLKGGPLPVLCMTRFPVVEYGIVNPINLSERYSEALGGWTEGEDEGYFFVKFNI